MSGHIPDGGPAFPNPAEIRDGIVYMDASAGMSLRDYFAGQAVGGSSADPGYRANEEERAIWAYKVADAMIKVRDQGQS